MNDVQRAATARADAVTKPAIDLYEARCRLMHITFDRLPRTDDLNRLHAILSRLSDSDLRQVAAYAEGLAEWNGT